MTMFLKTTLSFKEAAHAIWCTMPNGINHLQHTLRCGIVDCYPAHKKFQNACQPTARNFTQTRPRILMTLFITTLNGWLAKNCCITFIYWYSDFEDVKLGSLCSKTEHINVIYSKNAFRYLMQEQNTAPVCKHCEYQSERAWIIDFIHRPNGNTKYRRQPVTLKFSFYQNWIFLISSSNKITLQHLINQTS